MLTTREPESFSPLSKSNCTPRGLASSVREVLLSLGHQVGVEIIIVDVDTLSTPSNSVNWCGQPWQPMAGMWLRAMALHDADASSSFEKPPANLVVRALAVHAAQRQQTRQHSCSSRHLTRPFCSQYHSTTLFFTHVSHWSCRALHLSLDFATFLLCDLFLVLDFPCSWTRFFTLLLAMLFFPAVGDALSVLLL